MLLQHQGPPQVGWPLRELWSWHVPRPDFDCSPRMKKDCSFSSGPPRKTTLKMNWATELREIPPLLPRRVRTGIEIFQMPKIGLGPYPLFGTETRSVGHYTINSSIIHGASAGSSTDSICVGTDCFHTIGIPGSIGLQNCCYCQYHLPHCLILRVQIEVGLLLGTKGLISTHVCFRYQ